MPGLRPDNTVAAAELALEELASPLADSRVEQIIEAVRNVKEVLASGIVEEARRRCKELRRLLAVAAKENQIPSESAMLVATSTTKDENGSV